METLSIRQKLLFNALHESRKEDWKIFSKRDYKGIWTSVIDKYPESAHFVYELLQNADDAEASEVYIILKRNQLLFKHNGKKHFDITDVNDNSIKVPGDINSITGIGDSSKEENQNKIGKFGVGFKAVFQYTDSPEIYDDIFKFRIDNYIIPSLLEEDHPERKEGETLFVFPFNEQEKPFHEITRRLEHLENPILFLRNLRKVAYRIDYKKDKTGYNIEYTKDVEETFQYGNVKLEKLCLNNAFEKQYVFMFSEPIDIMGEDGDIHTHLINVGYFYDEEKKCLLTENKARIYCFFPTKETFNKCFVSHAPFLLTDNRQNLKPNEDLNIELLKALSKLVVYSILKLRDYGIDHDMLLINENITELIPSDSFRYAIYGRQDDPEYHLAKALQDVVRENKIFLTRDNEYIKIRDAYVTTPRSLGELLTKEQLQVLCGHPSANFLKWELAQSLKNKKITLINEYTSINFAKNISPSFMKTQSLTWVTRLYTFLRTDAVSLWKSLGNSSNAYLPFRFAPIIKTENGDWVSPYEDNDILNVFLPIEGNSSKEYNFIHHDYLNIDIARKFFDELEVKQPDEYDYIKSVILGRYRGDIEKENESVLQEEFKTLLHFYDTVEKTRGTVVKYEFIKLLKENLMLKAENDDFYDPSHLYLDKNEIKSYFGNNYFINYVDIAFYRSAANIYGETNLYSFFEELGVKSQPCIETKYISIIKSLHANQYNLVPSKENIKELDCTDYVLSHFEDVIKRNDFRLDLSSYIWNTVLPNCNLEKHKTALVSYRIKHTRTNEVVKVPSLLYILLNEANWIFNKSGELCNARNIFKEDLADEYDKGNGLIEFLGIEKKEKSIIELGGSEVQQEEMEMGQILKSLGIKSKDDLIKYRSALEQTIINQKSTQPTLNQNSSNNSSDKQSYNPKKQHKGSDSEVPSQSIEEKLEAKWEQMSNSSISRPKATGKKNSLSAEEIFGSNTEQSSDTKPFFDTTADNEKNSIAEKDSKTEKTFKEKSKAAQEKAEQASEQLKILGLFNDTPKYTYRWFKLLIELMHSEKAKAGKMQVQIDFQYNEIICSEKIIHLSNPSKVVPSWMANADNIQIAIMTDLPIKIKGTIVRSDEYSLDIQADVTDKIKRSLSKALIVRVIAENTSNYLDSLDKRFHQLGFADDYNLNDNLTKNISFIYGPPGTGKTTTLVHKVSEIINEKKGINVLILTPTNKAADVVAEKMVDDEVCYNWLTRYGSTESLYLIEDAGVVMSREDMDITQLDNNILVTTAARYAYDYIQPDDTFICDFNWDYIFIDEASMIDLVTIVYVLYKGMDSQIIISGDPKQIGPVVENGLPDYNIYDMVSLNSFGDAMRKYDRFPVEALTIQHRSVPTIGALISSFAYEGLVKSDLQRNAQKPLKLDGIKTTDINFVGFEIKEFDNLYGITTIKDSAFHLYAAIFTYNMVDYMVQQITKNHKGLSYSIGIVCPYGAEASAINQMLENRPLTTDNCSVMCGTVHSFQGDECDIMFVVLNPPIQCSRGSHINKENILNVAMSRTRDYLFFILPNGQIPGFYMKNRIGNKANETGATTILQCKDVEEIICGEKDYISSNTMVSCHMLVNVYCDNAAKYDVRISDDALDIKIIN